MFDILVIVVLQFGKDGAMQMEKHRETAYLMYFVLLSFLVIGCINTSECIISLIYLVVVLSCVLKFILIVNKN